jgi:hypothetical protein
VYDSEVRAHVLAMSEAGVLIPMCAWCERIKLEDEWVQPPRGALSVIDVRNAVSHSICPTCAKQTERPTNSA